MQWKILDNFTKDALITSIEFGITVDCNLRGTEIFVLMFNSPWLIEDIWDNKFQQKVLQTASFKYYYVSAAEAQMVAGAGDSFSMSSMATLGIVAVSVVFQYFLHVISFLGLLL